MAKTSRNAPWPCGSGKKYKKCCLAEEEAATAPKSPTEKSSVIRDFFEDDEDNLDELSNGVLDLIEAGKLDEAEEACAELRRQYPDVIDWMERTGMIHEARGETQKAIEYYRRCLTYIEENPVGFDEGSKDWYIRSIQKLTKGMETERGS